MIRGMFILNTEFTSSKYVQGTVFSEHWILIELNANLRRVLDNLSNTWTDTDRSIWLTHGQFIPRYRPHLNGRNTSMLSLFTVSWRDIRKYKNSYIYNGAATTSFVLHGNIYWVFVPLIRDGPQTMYLYILCI